MKKFIVNNVQMAIDVGNKENPRLTNFIIEGPEEMEASDGYHTFGELYEHRITLFIALCRQVALWNESSPKDVWRSKLHSDGSSFDGWFIMGIHKEKGKQITYHLPISKWNETSFAETLDRAPEWDGHSPADVLERLKKI